MDWSLVTSNLLNPPVLFFFAGLLAAWVGSDLDIPQPLPKLFSLYLLLAIGFRGGVELSHGSLSGTAVWTLVAAVALSLLVPISSFYLLRGRLGVANAAAVAATYGSVSAVTFIAATSFLGTLGIPHGGHMVAALALMESPAILVGVALFRLARPRDEGSGSHLPELLREALFNGSVFLLMVSLLIGWLTGDAGGQALAPFTEGIFKGMLCLFLLDMGLVSARRLRDSRVARPLTLGFAVLAPLAHATVAIFIARALGMGPGDAFLFTVLCASASYIAVPAALRLSIPEANPGLYVTMALGLTFPFNVLVGMPLFLAVIQFLWR